MDVTDPLPPFWKIEQLWTEFRERDDADSLCWSFSHIKRTYGFLEIILQRFLDAEKRFAEIRRKKTEVDEVAENHIIDCMELEAESFCLFAKILLDRIANCIRYAFGEPQG